MLPVMTHLIHYHIIGQTWQSPKHSDQTPYRQLPDVYRHKYAGKKIDLVIPFSAPALNWMTAHGDEIFP